MDEFLILNEANELDSFMICFISHDNNNHYQKNALLKKEKDPRLILMYIKIDVFDIQVRRLIVGCSTEIEMFTSLDDLADLVKEPESLFQICVSVFALIRRELLNAEKYELMNNYQQVETKLELFFKSSYLFKF